MCVCVFCFNLPLFLKSKNVWSGNQTLVPFVIQEEEVLASAGRGGDCSLAPIVSLTQKMAWSACKLCAFQTLDWLMIKARWVVWNCEASNLLLFIFKAFSSIQDKSERSLPALDKLLKILIELLRWSTMGMQKTPGPLNHWAHLIEIMILGSPVAKWRAEV